MVANKESVFFKLLRAGLWEQDVQLLDNEKAYLEEVYKTAIEQTVVGLITAGLEHALNIKLSKQTIIPFMGSVLTIEQRNMAMNLFVADIVTKLHSNGVYTLLVKGQGIAQCYERPSWRAAGDIDLFLDKGNYLKAKEVLFQEASFIAEENPFVLHQAIAIGQWSVELHGTLRCRLSYKIDSVIDKIQNETIGCRQVRVWNNDGVKIFLPSEDNDVIFVFTHILKHFYKEGLSLRQICDLCRLIWTYRETIDANLLESRLKSMKLMTIWKAFAALMVDWLGMPTEVVPFYSSDRKWSRKADAIMTFIIESARSEHSTAMGTGKSLLVRKAISFRQRMKDLLLHTRIFPLDSLRFFPCIVFSGLRSAAKGK